MTAMVPSRRDFLKGAAAAAAAGVVPMSVVKLAFAVIRSFRRVERLSCFSDFALLPKTSATSSKFLQQLRHIRPRSSPSRTCPPSKSCSRL